MRFFFCSSYSPNQSDSYTREFDEEVGLRMFFYIRLTINFVDIAIFGLGLGLGLFVFC